MTVPPAPADLAADPAQQALDWFTRLRAEDLSAAERQAFEQWRDTPENARAFAEVESLWQVLELPARRVRKAERVRGRRWPRLATAACLLLAAGVAWLQWPALQRLNSDYATRAGERGSFTLADGSQLRLDSNSAVDVELDGAIRTLHLRQGRLFLEVKHDGRPFVVNVDDAQVRVLGTRFSVARSDGVDEVVLESGKVQVLAGTQTQVLIPGQRLTVHGEQIDPPQAVDAERLLAWRDGQLRVRDVPLRDVLQRLADYQGQSLLLLDATAGQRLVSGSFNLDQADNALDALLSSQKLRADSLAGRWLIVR